MSKIICPYCFGEYTMNSILYTCPDCGATAMSRKIFNKTNKCKTPGCVGYASLRRCPNCYFEFPDSILEKPTVRIGISGMVCSGKTSYITAMLREFGQISDWGLQIQHHTDDLLEYQRENDRILFDEHRILPATCIGSAKPLIWEIVNYQNNKQRTQQFSCVTYDHAGEEFVYENDWIRDIKFSDAMIIVVDPLTLQGLRDSVDRNTLECSMAENLADEYFMRLFSSLAEMNRSNQNHMGKTKTSIPVAIVLTKIDTIMDRFGKDAIIKHKSTVFKDGKVNLEEVAQLNNEIKKWLAEVGEERLVNAADSLFKDYSFFAVSSYGTSPSTIGHMDAVYPHRVLDPILWLYNRTGFLK